MKQIMTICGLLAMALNGFASAFQLYHVSGIPSKVYYFAPHCIEDGSRCETAAILIHGWSGGCNLPGAAEPFADALAKAVGPSNTPPYVIAPLFPRRRILVKNGIKDDGRAVWNDSWGRDKSVHGKPDDDWRGGGDAAGVKLSSFEVVDAILLALGDKARYPALKRVVVTGFSAGGQFVGRYVAVGKGFVREDVEVRYAAMAPSTELRLDEDVTWHYGIKDRPRYSAQMTREQMLNNLSRRRVWRACGTADVLDKSLDVYSAAMQQGKNRYARFRSFEEYLKQYPEWAKQVTFHAIEGVGHESKVAHTEKVFIDYVLGNKANPDAIELAPLPMPVEFKSDMDKPVAFDASATVVVDCPDGEAVTWLKRHFAEWYGDQAPKVKEGRVSSRAAVPEGDEAYAISADASGVQIAAHTLAGVRWAACTMRQLAIAKRGTFRTEGRILPTIKVTDRPHLAFRAIHLCWFPEVRPQQMERAIRLAALLKFNYAIIEPWGMYASEKHPWWHWPNPTMTKAEVRRLVAIGRDLGITLIPQINAYGHATSSRSCTVKHAMLDLQPAYEPLFEPGGWNWCLSNPETQRVLRELIAEMHDDFGRPPFFHLGCDEAQPPSCPECRKMPYAELVCKHITGLAEFVKARGARAMIWHDMLLERGDPRWNGYVHHGTKTTAALVDTLPKDVIICDWQYSYGNMKESRKDWPTMAYFKEKGFPVAGCPWMNFNAMKPMADYISKIGGFGFIETTWHHLRGGDWVQMYKFASAAAWGTAIPPRTSMYDTAFGTALRLVGHDMKVTDYLDTGHLNYQVPPAWWVDNN